ncbi:MAG: hypothetical protein M1829_000802 [Trizodia sp. TS-e1964]|nr:MAG: hypothetical protein M1829_000802 [Trizodia sp. TS-e1964]
MTISYLHFTFMLVRTLRQSNQLANIGSSKNLQDGVGGEQEIPSTSDPACQLSSSVDPESGKTKLTAIAELLLGQKKTHLSSSLILDLIAICQQKDAEACCRDEESDLDVTGLNPLAGRKRRRKC